MEKNSDIITNQAIKQYRFNEKIIIHILYEDNHLLVVEKPVNVLSQEDNTKDVDMLTILKKYIKESCQKSGDVFLGLVHRLDRPVGGVMVFARTSKAASRLSEQIRNRTFHKTYLAVLEGQLKSKTGTLEDWLIKDETHNTVKVVHEGTPNAKKAILNYEVLSNTQERAMVKIDLVTGRSHQIRVQFAHADCPLYGDKKYGRIKTTDEGIALWSYSIELIHPTRKEPCFFRCDVPQTYPWKV